LRRARPGRNHQSVGVEGRSVVSEAHRSAVLMLRHGRWLVAQRCSARAAAGLLGRRLVHARCAGLVARGARAAGAPCAAGAAGAHARPRQRGAGGRGPCAAEREEGQRDAPEPHVLRDLLTSAKKEVRVKSGEKVETVDIVTLECTPGGPRWQALHRQGWANSRLSVCWRGTGLTRGSDPKYENDPKAARPRSSACRPSHGIYGHYVEPGSDSVVTRRDGAWAIVRTLLLDIDARAGVEEKMVRRL